MKPLLLATALCVTAYPAYAQDWPYKSVHRLSLSTEPQLWPFPSNNTAFPPPKMLRHVRLIRIDPAPCSSGYLACLGRYVVYDGTSQQDVFGYDAPDSADQVTGAICDMAYHEDWLSGQLPAGVSLGPALIADNISCTKP